MPGLNIAVGPQIIRNEIGRGLLAHAATMRLGVTAEDAKANKLDFLRYVLQDEEGNPLKADHTVRLFVDVWEQCRLLNRHLSIVTPPGFGKTTLALGCMVDDIGRNPGLRTVVVTADLKESRNIVALGRSLVLTDHFMDVYPESQPDVERSSDARGWRMDSWFMRAVGQRKDPTMSAHAMEPKKESIRVDEGLFDDMVTEDTCDGKKHENVVRRFYVTWKEGRCAPKGRMIYQQNVRRRGDLAHLLREDPTFTSMWIGVTPDCERLFVHVWNPPPAFPLKVRPAMYKAREEKPGEDAPAPHLRFTLPLPERQGWDVEKLLAINPGARSQLYHLRAVRSEDIIMQNWATRQQYHGTAAEMAGLKVDADGWPLMTDLDRRRYAILGGLDFSSTKRPGCALWIILKNGKGEIFPLFLDMGRWTVGDIILRLNRLHANGVWVQKLGVEDNGVQDMLLQSVKTAQEGAPWAGALAGHTTGSNKWNQQIGLPWLDQLLQAQVIWWPTMEAKRRSPWNSWWAQFEMNAETMTRDMTVTPDEWMAFWIAVTAGRNFGPVVTSQKPLTVRVDRGEDVLGVTQKNVLKDFAGEDDGDY